MFLPPERVNMNKKFLAALAAAVVGGTILIPTQSQAATGQTLLVWTDSVRKP